MSSIKKMSLSAATLAFSALAFAGPDLDTRVQNLEKDMHHVKTKTAAGTVGAKTALARPEVEGVGYFASLDVLYWHAKVSDTKYAHTSINDGTPLLPVKGELKEIDFDWDFGFRVGFGVNFNHGGWDLGVEYTYFSTDGSSSVSSQNGGTVVPQQTFIGIASPDANLLTNIDKATSQFGVDFDKIDLALGRNFFVSHQLSLRPNVGLTTAWMNLTQTTRYTGGEVGINTVYFESESDFWGLGPMAGCDTKWYLTNGFSIFGNVSGALLYGHFDTKLKTWYSAELNNSIRMSNNMHQFAPTTEIVIGLAYDQYICNDKQHIGVSLGYDCQYWWSVNQSMNISSQSTEVGPLGFDNQDGNVSLHGVTLHLKWDF